MNEFFRLRIHIWGILTAAGFLALLCSIAGFLGQYAWWLDLGSHFRVQYTVFFAALAICYVIGRKWPWAMGAGILMGINLIPILTLIFPRIEKPIGNGPILRAMLINVNTELGNPVTVIREIEKENPDLIVLEEINTKWIEALAPIFRSYLCQAVEPRTDNFGIAILCRTKGATASVFTIGEAEVPSVLAQVPINGRKLTILGTHSLPPGGPEYSYYRNEQLQRIVDYVQAQSGPLLLLGDLNVSPWSYYFHRLLRTSGLKNSSQGRGLYPTWPTFSPLFYIPIDHCLHSDDIVIHDKKVGSHIGSDHCPLIIDFALR